MARKSNSTRIKLQIRFLRTNQSELTKTKCKKTNIAQYNNNSIFAFNY